MGDEGLEELVGPCRHRVRPEHVLPEAHVEHDDLIRLDEGSNVEHGREDVVPSDEDRWDRGG